MTVTLYYIKNAMYIGKYFESLIIIDNIVYVKCISIAVSVTIVLTSTVLGTGVWVVAVSVTYSPPFAIILYTGTPIRIYIFTLLVSATASVKVFIIRYRFLYKQWGYDAIIPILLHYIYRRRSTRPSKRPSGTRPVERLGPYLPRWGGTYGIKVIWTLIWFIQGFIQKNPTSKWGCWQKMTPC